jgi:hypothetical protein
MVLDHAQVDPEPMQVELEWRRNFQRAHGGFDLGEPSLMLGKLQILPQILPEDSLTAPAKPIVRLRSRPGPQPPRHDVGLSADCAWV